MATEWYYTSDRRKLGPVSSRDLRTLAAQGKLSSGDYVWRAGLPRWEQVSVVPGLMGMKTDGMVRNSSRATGMASVKTRVETPGDSVKQPEMAPPSDNDRIGCVKEKAKDTFRMYRLFWSRICRSDFNWIRATPQEVAALESAATPVGSSLAQDYASWRRSLLMVCVLVLGVTLAFSANDIRLGMSDDSRHPVMRVQNGVFFLFQVISFGLCLVAAARWSSIPSSKAYATAAWLVQFAGPFLVLLLPLSLFVSSKMALLALGLHSVAVLAPKIFGLFPGIIRCSLSLKTLLPESAVPGWLCMLAAPVYALFLVLAAITALQTSFVILGAGLLLLAAGSSAVFVRARSILSPASQEDASQAVARVRRIQFLFQSAGLSLVAFQVIRHADFQWDWVNSIVVFIFSFLGNVTLLTVVMSDSLLCMIHQGQRQAESVAGTDIADGFQKRLVQLADCGLTDFGARKIGAVTGFGNRLNRLGRLKVPGSRSLPVAG